MILENQNILFLTRTMKLGGTENVILQLCEILKDRVNKIIVCSCGGVNIEKLEELSIKHYEIPDIEMKTPKVIFTALNKISKIIKEEEITVVHTHHRMAAFYIRILKKRYDVKFINTSHNTFSNRIKFTRFSYKNANLIACGEMVKKNLVNTFKIEEPRVTVVHNAVKAFDGNLQEDNLLRSLRSEGCFLIGNIGRLSEQKGMKYFIKSIPKIIEQCPQSRFVVVGDGEDSLQLKQLVSEMKLDDYCYFMGYRNDIQNVMSQLDLIVLSSLWEGLPLTPIEAFSVGKTIVATDVDGTPEIVKNNINGLLVKPRDYKSLAEKCIYMIKESEIRAKYEQEAINTYNSEFSFEKFQNEYIKYYLSV